eukprot:2324832-Amphidinium_carterae.1
MLEFFMCFFGSLFPSWPYPEQASEGHLYGLVPWTVWKVYLLCSCAHCSALLSIAALQTMP